MATRFQSLPLQRPDLFGVRLNGAVGRSDKQNLMEVVDKCLAKGKLKVVLDLTDLGSIGGGGAAILADFQRQLLARGGEAVIAGAGETVRQFIAPKFDGLPLRFFGSVAEADADFERGGSTLAALAQVPRAKMNPDLPLAAAGNRAEAAPDANEAAEIGAIGFMDDEADLGFDDTLEDTLDAVGDGLTTNAEGSLAVSEVLEEFNGPSPDPEETGLGRRKGHKYTSLPEAVAALGNWSEYEGHVEFAKSLGNLLFSHGLADDSLLLTVQDGVLIDANQDWALDVDGDLVMQVKDLGAPMTMLDVQTQALSDREISLLETVNPDMILPIMRDDQLSAILLLNRHGEDNEYSVAEHFALELLMRVLAENQGQGGAGANRRGASLSGGLNTSATATAGETALAPQVKVPGEDSLSDVLLELALNLPDAEDRAHFWRLFARHVWQILPVTKLAFLPPRMHRAQIIVGNSDEWHGTNLGEKKLQHFFRSMERPVEVACLPTFFKEIKASLTGTGSQWIVGLNWDQEFLGTVFIAMEPQFRMKDPRDLLVAIFTETARLLSRFDDSHDNADVNMNLVRLLIAQREQRCYGTDQLTQAMCDELHRLANVMGFPPEQERNLIYGCLLRDVGLLAAPDALMGSPEQLDPTQWPLYRRHPAEGVKLLTALGLPQTILDVVRCHHERFNGEGFPMGLKGRKIPLAARLVTVVENYVSMIHGVGRRAPMTSEQAAQVLCENLGDRYDPDIVGVFLKAKEADLDDPAGEMLGRHRRVPARV